MKVPTYLDAFPRRRARALYALAIGLGREPRATGLRIDTDGHLSEVTVAATDPWSAIRVHVDTRADLATGGGAGAETLDRDLAMWFDLDGAEHARHNPVASVVAAMFGRPGTVFGPVVFTGCAPPPPGYPLGEAGEVRDVSVAATLLLAGTARTCDPHASVVDRAAEFARLDVDIVPAPRTAPDHIEPAGGGPDDEPVVSCDASYDSLAHTLTADGDLPRCAECDEYTSTGHPEHQPEVLAENDTGTR